MIHRLDFDGKQKQGDLSSTKEKGMLFVRSQVVVLLQLAVPLLAC